VYLQQLNGVYFQYVLISRVESPPGEQVWNVYRYTCGGRRLYASDEWYKYTERA